MAERPTEQAYKRDARSWKSKIQELQILDFRLQIERSFLPAIRNTIQLQICNLQS